MGHHIDGFVGRQDDLITVAASLPGSRVVPLNLGFAFLPLTEPVGDEPVPFEELTRLDARHAAWGRMQSRVFPLAYVETDYFGGDGWQAALVWAGGLVVVGPIRTTDLQVHGKFVPTPLLEGAINRALRFLAVKRGAVRDEFDAVGLGRHGSNKVWLAESSS